jgi:hypothetical protein
MTKKEFLNAVSNCKEDIIQIFLDALTTSKANYCAIGGLAVNAYAEPVVSLDLDIIVAAENIEDLCNTIEAHFKIERFADSVNLSSDKSDLRIADLFGLSEPEFENHVISIAIPWLTS